MTLLYYYIWTVFFYSLIINFYLYRKAARGETLNFIKNPQLKHHQGNILLLSFFIAPIVILYTLVTVALWPLISWAGKRKIKKENNDLDAYLAEVNSYKKA